MYINDAYQLSTKIGKLFYSGDDQTAWNLVVDFVDVLQKIQKQQIYDQNVLMSLYKHLENTYTYKASLNFTLIADTFIFKINPILLELEEGNRVT